MIKFKTLKFAALTAVVLTLQACVLEPLPPEGPPAVAYQPCCAAYPGYYGYYAPPVGVYYGGGGYYHGGGYYRGGGYGRRY